MGKKSLIVAFGLILLIAAVLLAESGNQPTVEELRKGRLRGSSAAAIWTGEQPKPEVPVPTSPAAIYTVNNTGDAGPGTLRQAILNANANAGHDVIQFNIAPPGVLHTIFPLTPLPWLLDNAGVTIDGLTQPGGATQGASPPSSLNLSIEIDGINCPSVGPPGATRGLVLQSSNDTIQGLIVNNWWESGICTQGGPINEYAQFNLVRWNISGMDSTGTVCKGNGRGKTALWAGICICNAPQEGPAFASYNTIEENLSSCNYTEGITVVGPIQPGDVHNNFVLGNYVGTDITGTLDRGNVHEGICLCEGTHHNLVRRNLSSGNDYDGIGAQGYNNVPYPPAPPIQTHSNQIDSNTVGLDANGNPLPNTMAGITVGEYGPSQWGCADKNTIEHNNIAENGWDGVAVWEDGVNSFNADNNLISQNSIYDNIGLGIDLQNDGVTPNDGINDPDWLANQEMNFPVITSATYSGGNTTISGTLAILPPNTATVEVFQARLDPSGYGEGERYLGSAITDAAGNWGLTDATLLPGDSVTATATDASNNTSEFSATIEVTQPDWDCTDNPPPGKTAGGYEAESNDNCATANYAACETAYCGDIVPNTDVDWWVVTLPTDTCYCLHVRVLADDTPGQYAYGGGLNPNLTIYASDCVTQLFYNDDYNGTFPDAVGQDSQYDCLDPGNCHQPGSTLYIKIASSQYTSGPYLLIINCDTCACPTAELDTCEYYKPAYVDYAPAGMPDFDQKQDAWTSPVSGAWSHCGPVALGDCFWWFDSKFDTSTTPPPAINDNYPLVQNYTGALVDDHNASNVIPFVDSMALYCNTNPPGQSGTNVFDLATGAQNWLNKVGLGTKFNIQVVPIDPVFGFEYIREQVLLSQDVILLIGFWQEVGADYCERRGGHFLTVAGVCTDPADSAICVSDPYFDLNGGNPPGPPPHGAGVHNDAQYVSGPHGTMHHDKYYVIPAMCAPSGGDPWVVELANYAAVPGNVANFDGQNSYDPTAAPAPPNGLPVHALIEFAVVICPVEEVPEPTIGKVKHCIDTLSYNPSMGSPVGTNWHELWPDYCEHWICSSWIDNGDGVLSYCDTIDFTHIPTGRKIWEHVELVTPTITVSDLSVPGDIMYLDCLDPNPLCTAITSPIGTYWHEVNPTYCTVWKITSWTDNGNGYLDYCDDIDLETIGGVATFNGHVDGIETDVITTPLPIPDADEYDHNIDGYVPSNGDPTGTMWHELWPVYCQWWELSEWHDNGDGVLSFCDTIKFRSPVEPDSIILKHVEEVTLTIKAANEIDSFYFDFMCGNPNVDPITDPINTFWHQVWPSFCQRYLCVGWTDNGSGVLDFCDYIDLMAISGPDSGTVAQYHVKAAETDIITTYIPTGVPGDTCDYYKKSYGDYSPFSIPDFDQKQDGWIGGPGPAWSYCGPVAMADCFWWMDSRFEPNPVDPRPFYPGPGNPPPNDGYPLVQSYEPTGGLWDDHDTNNVIPFVDSLALYSNCNPGTNGTWIMDLYNGAIGWIAKYGLDTVDNDLRVNPIPSPDFDIIKTELLNCEDVILLLGFYEDQGGVCCRLGGHYVTVAGVCTTDTRICISDPWYDKNEGEPPAGSAHGPSIHNDAWYISGPHGQVQHDAYFSPDNPMLCMHPQPPIVELVDYPDLWPDIQNFQALNPTEPMMPPCTYSGGDIYTMVDWALTISPCCLNRGNADHIIGIGGPIDVADLTYLVKYLFKNGPVPPCLEEGNVDGIIGPGGPIDVADLTYLVYYLFKNGPAPPPCP